MKKNLTSYCFHGIILSLQSRGVKMNQIKNKLPGTFSGTNLPDPLFAIGSVPGFSF